MADDDRKIVDEEDALIQQQLADMSGLPLDYQADGQSIARSSLIAKPDARQLQVFQNRRIRTCGSCHHFRHEAFQQVAPEFMKRLVHEYEWNPKFIGDHPSKMGRCSENAEIVVGPNSLGCDHYRTK